MTTLSDLATHEPDIDDGDLRTVGSRTLVQRLFGAGGLWVLLIDILLILLFSAVTRRHAFWSVGNLKLQLVNGSEGLLMALGITLLLGAGLIDISVGANLVVSSVVAAKIMGKIATGSNTALAASGSQGFHHVGTAVLVGLIVCLVVGMLFGLINGLIISYLKVNSLIATLATTFIALGIVTVETGGTDVGGLPPALRKFSVNRLFDVIPYPAVVALGLAVVLWAVVRFTRFGMRTLAIGSSEVAAQRSGINVRRHVLELTVISGGLAGLAGFVSLAHYNATSINGYSGAGLSAITATVIGGTALAGGRIHVLGTVWGTALSGILIGGLAMRSVSSGYQQIVIGMILIIVVAADMRRSGIITFTGRQQ